jgi:hypothetical protein
MNEYSFNEKELIRSIADIIISNPYYFSQVFSDSEIYDVFPTLKNIVQYIQISEIYDISEIKEHMNNIDDVTIKAIFLRSFNCWINQ